MISDAHYRIEEPTNEPHLQYAPGSKERRLLKEELDRQLATETEVPMVIGGQAVRTDNRVKIAPPHDHQFALGYHHRGNAEHVKQAIEAALAAKAQWEATPWQHRVAIFLKAADLIAGKYRYKMNAAAMLAQSKTPHQSEIEAVGELCDFLRFNAYYLQQLYENQPHSPKGQWNRMEYRPLEGFVLAITPFNFSAIAGNLPSVPAMCGNVSIWKPADSQLYASYTIMEIFQEAGLPDGVINLIYADGPDVGDAVFKHPDFGGLHFTGSYETFTKLWQVIGENIRTYKSFPRVVGETGGKDFVVMHHTADSRQVATALTRGAFEYQGQKCSAASRAYIPESKFDEVVGYLTEDHARLRVGNPLDFGVFMGAVIDEAAFNKITGYLQRAEQDPDVDVLLGGSYDGRHGYFIQPTVLHSKKPDTEVMSEEIFGPVLTLYKYPDDQWEEALRLTDETSPYALTGAIFARDRYAITQAEWRLRNAAGNLYINDKPTGSIVHQQPFGGARASGTNDKAGSFLNVTRWLSARSIKETYDAPLDFSYPYMQPED